MYGKTGIRRGVVFGLAWVQAAVLGTEAADLPAQEAAVSGRVVAAGSATGLPGITVELVGHGLTATDGEGSFSLRGVPEGGYTLNVVGFGFQPRSQYVFVKRDAALVVTLRPSPVALSRRSIGEPAATVAGRIREAGPRGPSEGGPSTRPASISSAEILTNQGHIVRADHEGRFRLEGAIPGVPLSVTIRAFGYRPFEAVVAPGREDLSFELERDPQVQQMIATEVRRLGRRTVGHADLAPPLERAELVDHPAASVGELIRTELGSHHGRIRCVIVDDRLLFEPDAFLDRTRPQELERVELLAHPGDADLAMLRVYTRLFLRDMVGGSLRLASPQFLAVTRDGSPDGPAVCR